jgi:ligand-binding sensor domain-containing protein
MKIKNRLLPILFGLLTFSVITLSGTSGAVRSEDTPSQENAVWEVFTEQSHIQAIALSEETLWVGTSGSLEQRDATTGELVRVFTNLEGLPSNNVSALESDESGGLWIGTDGLAYRSVSGDWTFYNTENSELPDNHIKALESDGSGGLWIVTSYELVYRRANGEWKIYDKNNSDLPYNNIGNLESDGSGGLWIGAEKGLAYRSASGEWTLYNTENSPLPDNDIWALESDGRGGLWIGTHYGGVAYRSVSGDWTIYNTENSELPSPHIKDIESDGSGGLWIGTEFDGLAYRSVSGDWRVYNERNSVLPSNHIYALLRDERGGLWIGTEQGLAYRSAGDEWKSYKEKNLGLPDNAVMALKSDGDDGLWIGTHYGGLAYRNVSGEWTIYNAENSELPSNHIYALESDDSGGLWIGNYSGLAYRSAGDVWKIYDKNNSGLPYDTIRNIESDGSGGLWIGGWEESGLAYRSASGEWTLYNKDNSPLPHNMVNALLSDEHGGLLIGTDSGGLAYRSVSNEWTIYNTENSALPSNYVYAFLSDEHGGLWIGTSDGLAYRSVSGEWTLYNQGNSVLPYNYVYILESDGNGGLWIGTKGGLAHRSAGDDWTAYKSNNSGLPNNFVNALLSDGSSGVWIGTRGGLAHLTFSQKDSLCPDLNDVECQNLRTGNRAAIIIAGGGHDKSNTLWDTTAAISDNIYKLFSKRGFDNDEIYYLSPQSYADFNGDGFDDCIVDAPATPRCHLSSVDNPIDERPLSVEDVRDAFAWAKTRGQLDQPLYVFFINHGGTDKFQLTKGGYLDVLDFKAILDDYQNETGNQVALVIDTCYSGVLLEKLIASNRAMISSTGNGLAYFDRTTKQGFSRFFANGLLKGMNFYEAFDHAHKKQDKLVKSFSIGQDQIPQWYDGSADGQWLRQIFINGSFTVADITLTATALTTSTTLTVGQSLPLRAKVSLAQGNVEQVWAVLKPPKVNLVMDSNGTPILAFPHFELSRSGEEDVWASTWRDAVYNGEYEITFYAEDNEGNIAGSDSITVNVIGGVELPEGASVQIELAKERYQRGESFQAQVTEDLAWGYDLYAAVLLPDGNFFALRDTNQLAGVNEPKNWVGERTAHHPVTLFELSLPESLPIGRYCLYGILSPEKELVLETLPLWVWTERCFEVF